MIPLFLVRNLFKLGFMVGWRAVFFLGCLATGIVNLWVNMAVLMSSILLSGCVIKPGR